MSISGIKVDSQTFSLFQKELHRPLGAVDKNDDDKITRNEKIHSIFQHRFRKISWYSPVKEILETNGGGNDDNVTYIANNTYDHLFKSFLNVQLPAIKVDDKKANEYRIAWTHNIGININKLAKLMINDIVVNSFDSTSHDIASQYGYITKSGFKKHHLISIGSVPRLEEWTNFLPAHHLNVLQPFYYTKANFLALPLLKSSTTQFKHVYNFRRRILDLLRMQRLNPVTGKWVDILPKPEVIEGIKDKDSLIPLPELWGRYSRITDEERNWFRHCGDTHEYFYDNFLAFDDTNSRSYEEVASVDINSATPVKAIFWVSENTNSSRLNNFSNYTTNITNVYQGWNPHGQFKLERGEQVIMDSKSIIRAEREEVWEFPRAPWEPGYNAITFCNNPFSIDGEASISLQGSKTKLTVKITNGNPDLIMPNNYAKRDDLDDFAQTTEVVPSNVVVQKEINPSFIVKVRLLVYKKLSYGYDEKSGGYIYRVDQLDPSQVWYDDEVKRLAEKRRTK